MEQKIKHLKLILLRYTLLTWCGTVPAVLVCAQKAQVMALLCVVVGEIHSLSQVLSVVPSEF